MDDTDSRPSPQPSLTESTFPGLAALLRAYTYARDAGLGIWEFALEIDQLYELGLTISDLRWLQAKGFAEHGNEVSTYGDPHRSFEKSDGLNFESRTCFVLTAGGAIFASRSVASAQDYDPHDAPLPLNGEEAPAANENPPPKAIECTPGQPGAKPQWNPARRELYFGGVLVKRFRVPARNQEWILEVFEEDGWPEFIDDPLPPSPNVDPKARLHDAINRLNKKQVNAILRFHGNGNGKGVYWETVRLGEI